MDEFELIRRFFDRQASVPGVVTGIGDDGAILKPSRTLDQVQVVDTLVEGVHFLRDSDPGDIGYRAVAVNVSDIAAMGGYPRWMTLALTLPPKDEQWVGEFARGLFDAAAEYDLALVGGDMTSGEMVVATVHVTGEVEEGKALLRSGARVGDTIFVTGTFGDAAAGLELLRRGESDDFLLGRYLRPVARVAEGRALVGTASAAIDVSDGLVGDLKKLLDASGVGGELEIENVPMSDEVKTHFDEEDCTRLALTGGDDYELCFTAGPGKPEQLAGATAIGTVTSEPGLVCRHNGVIVQYDDTGYRHFQ